MTEHEEAKAREQWCEVRTGQKDFFWTNQFLSEQIRKARRTSNHFRTQRWVLMAFVALTMLVLYFVMDER